MSRQPLSRLFDEVTVSLSEARDLLAPFGVLQVDAVAPLSGGIVNTNVRVDAGGEAYLLRIYCAGRTLEEIAFELSILRHLARHGFACQEPLWTAQGEGLGRWNGRYYVALRFLHGSTLTQQELSPSVSAQIGRALGEFHTLVDGFVPEGARPREDVP